MTRKGVASDYTFRDRYKLASSLSPLPLDLSSEADIEKFLKNIKIVHEIALEMWLERNNFKTIISALYNNRQIGNSGITHRFLFPQCLTYLDDSIFRENYFSLLKVIKQPAELFGHAVHLKSHLDAIEFDEETRQKYNQTNEVKKFLEETLLYLKNRLSHTNNAHERSPEEFCHHIYSISKIQIEEIGLEINDRLKKYDVFDFEQLVLALAMKLGDRCRSFLLDEHQVRVLNLPSIKRLIFWNCFDQMRRINYFNRWIRLLPEEFPQNQIYSLESLNRFLSYNIYSLPLMLNDTSLCDLLDDYQGLLIEKVKSYLDITIMQDLTLINTIKDIDINTEIGPIMDYLFMSLAKQLYCQSRERFGTELINWIHTLSCDRAADYRTRTFGELVNFINP